MRSVLFLLAVILCVTGRTFAQSAFEVATIKPVDTTKGIMDAGITVYPGGRIVVHALPLKSIVVAAFDLDYWQVSGGEAWVEKDVYDIEAKPAAESGNYSLQHSRNRIGDARVRQMLQTLLAQRFHLKVQRETKTGPIYLLETSGKKFLLRPTKYAEDHPVQGAPGFSGEVEHVGGHWFLFDTSAPQLAKFASNYVLHKPVVDRTGLEGSFDYREPDAKTEQDNSDAEASFIFFLREVGLKLTASRGPVETLMIEHAEKPTAN